MFLLFVSIEGIPTCTQHSLTWFQRRPDDDPKKCRNMLPPYNKWCVWRILFLSFDVYCCFCCCCYLVVIVVKFEVDYCLEDKETPRFLKVEVKLSLEQAKLAQRGGRGTALLFNLGARWGGWSTPRLGPFTPGKDLIRNVEETGRGSGLVWTDAENLAPTGIRSPDRLACNELLNRLSYLGPPSILKKKTQTFLMVYKKARHCTPTCASLIQSKVLNWTPSGSVQTSPLFSMSMDFAIKEVKRIGMDWIDFTFQFHRVWVLSYIFLGTKTIKIHFTVNSSDGILKTRTIYRILLLSAEPQRSF